MLSLSEIDRALHFIPLALGANSVWDLGGEGLKPCFDNIE